MPTTPFDNYASYKAVAAHVPNPFSREITPGPSFERVEVTVQNLSADGDPVYTFQVSRFEGVYFIDLGPALKVLSLQGLADNMPDTFDAYIDKDLGKLIRVAFIEVYTSTDLINATWDLWLLCASRPIATAAGSVLAPYDPQTEDRAALIPSPLYFDETDGTGEALVTSLTVFKGYPIDIAVLNKGGGGTVEIVDGSGTAAYSVTAASDDIVVRLPINTTTADNGDLDVTEGRKTWVITFDGEDDETTVSVDVVDRCGVVYLKWLNSLGSWSYWLFDPVFRLREKGKTVEEVGEFVGEFYGAESNRRPHAKESDRTLETVATGLTRQQAEMLEELKTSPAVYLYKSDRLARYIGTQNWRRVDVEKFDHDLARSRRNLYAVQVAIKLPAVYLQTM